MSPDLHIIIEYVEKKNREREILAMMGYMRMLIVAIKMANHLFYLEHNYVKRENSNPHRVLII